MSEYHALVLSFVLSEIDEATFAPEHWRHIDDRAVESLWGIVEGLRADRDMGYLEPAALRREILAAWLHLSSERPLRPDEGNDILDTPW